MKCPWRKEIVTSFDLDGNKTVIVNFKDCYEYECPFWSTLRSKCVRPNCEEEKK